MLNVPHFSAFLLNPGTGHIPDLNQYLPWHEEWFSSAISGESLRVTHACVKNEFGRYSPTWLQPGETIRKTIVDLLSRRIRTHQAAVHDKQPALSSLSKKKKENSGNMEKKSRFQLFGPKLNLMLLSTADKGNSSPMVKADELITKFEQYHKGYSTSENESSAQESSL